MLMARVMVRTPRMLSTNPALAWNFKREVLLADLSTFFLFLPQWSGWFDFLFGGFFSRLHQIIYKLVFSTNIICIKGKVSIG